VVPEVLQEDTAEPDVDQTMILPVAAARSPELSVPELSEAELSEAELSEAELSEAELSEAELSEAELSEAELSEAELSEANRGDEGEEQFTERGDEDRTTAGSQLTEAMR
jgi:hypothetical protein